MKNLMPESVVTTPATIADVEEDSDADSDNTGADNRSIPPCIKVNCADFIKAVLCTVLWTFRNCEEVEKKRSIVWSVASLPWIMTKS